MAAANIELIVSAIDHATAPLRSVMGALGGITKSLGTGLGMGAGIAAFQGLSDAAGKLLSLPAQIIDISAANERLRISLEAITGSAAGAQQALSFIETFTAKTQLEMAETQKMFMFLKNAGIDPMKGAMQGFVDIAAKYGIAGDSIVEITRQWSQAQMKGKLQMEEINVLTERGVPILNALQQALGKSGEQILEMSKKGQIGIPQMNAAFQSLATGAAGSAAQAAGSWSGMLSTLSDTWTSFLRRIGDAGFFDTIRNKLREFMTVLEQMEASGALDRLAKAIGDNLSRAVNMALSGATALWNAIRSWADPAGTAATQVDVLAMATAKLGQTLKPMLDTVTGIAGGLKTIGDAASAVASRMGPLITLGEKFNQLNWGIWKMWGKAADAAGLGSGNAAGGAAPPPAAMPSATAAAAKAQPAPQRQDVGGEVRVKVEAAPGTKATIADSKSRNQKVPLRADSGLLMGVP